MELYRTVLTIMERAINILHYNVEDIKVAHTDIQFCSELIGLDYTPDRTTEELLKQIVHRCNCELQCTGEDSNILEFALTVITSAHDSVMMNAMERDEREG